MTGTPCTTHGVRSTEHIAQPLYRAEVLCVSAFPIEGGVDDASRVTVRYVGLCANNLKLLLVAGFVVAALYVCDLVDFDLPAVLEQCLFGVRGQRDKACVLFRGPLFVPSLENQA